MTVEEHIEELIAQAKNDLGASDALALAGYYAHSLFFAHLVLEKLCKALWIKHKQAKDYPYTHNLTRLLRETKLSITDEQKIFYEDMNKFQAEGRYPETLSTIEKTTTLNIYNDYSKLIKQETTWLIKQLQ